jgi:2-keto-4-pentenoate hydratase/2-oxohepta-3-ene-1,7-dioic acid hydratase in catechol pathway
VIATGTPSGVGSASGNFLRAGDLVRATIGPIGTLENPVDDEGQEDL